MISFSSPSLTHLLSLSETKYGTFTQGDVAETPSQSELRIANESLSINAMLALGHVHPAPNYDKQWEASIYKRTLTQVTYFAGL
jgi:hypothetical protein